MPLDTSIPLQFVLPKFDLPDPAAAADRQYNALRAQALQQEMMRNQLIMQNTMEDRARAEENRRAAAAQAAAAQRQKEEMMRVLQSGYRPAREAVMGPGTIQGSTPAGYDFSGVTNAMLQRGNIGAVEELSKLQQQIAGQQKAEAEVPGVRAESRKKGIEADAAQDAADWDMYRRGALTVMRDGDLTPIISGIFNHPRLGAKLKQIYPDVTSALAAAEDLRVNNPQGFAAMFMASKDQFDKMVDAAIKPTTSAPDLKKGERFNEQTGRVETVPGSDIYVQQSTKHGKDFGALNYLDAKTAFTTETIDKILDKKNAEGFSGNFGGYNAAYVTQYMPGKTQDVKADIDTLKSQLKNVGMDMLRQGGSVGQMTEKEWPIVEQLLGTITPYMSEEKAREILEQVKARVENIFEKAKETYDTTWGETQYYKGAGKKSSGSKNAPNEFEGFTIKEK